MSKQLNRKIYSEQKKISNLRKLKNKILNIIVRFTIIPGLRIFLYRLIGIKMGKDVFVGLDCYLDDEVPWLIRIEDNVIISFRVTMVAHDDSKGKVSAPIIIRKGAFIGTGAIILMGVEIGENAVVGAGSIVTKNVENGETVIGTSAKPLKK